MTAPAVTVTFVANTILTAGNLNTDFSDLVTYLSNRNDGSAVWDRALVTSGSAVPLIVNNSTGTANIANFQDNGSNVFQIIDGGDVYMNATKKLFLDGGGDSYIYESGANIIGFVAGGTANFQINGDTDLVSVLAANIAIPSTNRIYFDGGGDTYIDEISANVIQVVTAGGEIFRFNTTSVQIPATYRLYLDGGVDTYIDEVSGNVIQVVTGAGEVFRFNTTSVQVPATYKIYLDGGGDTYLVESSANVLDSVAGATTAFRLDTSATATHTRMQVYDVDNGQLERVTVGAADSGGAGFKVLRIPN